MSETSKEHDLLILKKKIKAWELDFRTCNQRKPEKNDIRLAPPDIKDAYKIYWDHKKKEGEVVTKNRVDAWSEKFNKANIEKNKVETSKEILKSFCSKIRERSLVNTKKLTFSEKLKHQSNNNLKPDSRLEQLDNQSDKNVLCSNNSTSKLDIDLDFKIEVKKSDTKIIKFNDTPKKVKNVNIISPSVNIKHLENKLCFETDLNKKWLERCSKDILDDSIKISESNSFNESKKLSYILDHNSKSSDNTSFENGLCNSKSLLFGSISTELDSVNLHSSSKTDCESFDFTNEACDSHPSVTKNSSVNFSLKNESYNLQNPKLDINSINYDFEDKSCHSHLSPEKTFIEHDNCNKSCNSHPMPENSIQHSIANISYNSHSSTQKTNSGDLDITKNICNSSFSPNKTNYEFVKDNSDENEPPRKKNEVPFISLNSYEDKTDYNKESSFITNSQIKQTFVEESGIEIPKSRKGTKRKLSKNSVPGNNLTSRLERKILTGTLNENYVKVNIKKKKFCRGHRTVNIRKMKWKKWKDLKKMGDNQINMSSPSACFKCGQIGHWARKCNVQAKESISEEFENDLDDLPLPTLEDAARLAEQSKSNLNNAITVKIYETTKSLTKEDSAGDILGDEVYQNMLEGDSFFEDEPVYNEVTPIYKYPSETPEEVFSALNELGYASFRKGQERAVLRILSGLSTLVVLPTGSGKSLCYQLPAYIYAKKFKSLALVVSPLVSLMEDQVTGLPSCLNAVCLHSGMTDVQKKTVMQEITDGKVQILLVSPEAVIGGYSYGCGIMPSNMPAISFACIDEAHCLSQWSHNFRPSYLQLYKVLTQRLSVKCILGLTATANQSTVKEIIQHLNINDMKESVVGSTGIPDNLHLSVSRDKDKDKALINLLTGERFNSCSSIIIYCIRRVETERLATLIRTCLQDHTTSEPPPKKSKSKSNKRNFLWTAEAYHAGLAPPRRRSIQKQFMNGKLRVVIATIAFGMGLDKKDVRAVIHYNMPKSFESYVQEIGRAGRDGLDAHCHLFLDSEGKDVQELQRHIYSNGTDRYIIRKLLRKVFIPCKCKPEKEILVGNESNANFKKNCPKHEIAFSINDTVQELDLKEENISTLLCYLELHPKKWIEVLPPTYATCTVRCYSGPKQLQALALKHPSIAAAYALDIKKGKKIENTSYYQFNIIEVASVMGWNTAAVKRELKRLEWNDSKKKTGIIVEFTDLSFHVLAPGNLKDEELDNILDFLHSKVVSSERKELQNLESLVSIFTKYSHSHYWACCDDVDTAHSLGIKEEINNYFDGTENIEDIENTSFLGVIENKTDIDISDIRSQIRDIIYTNNDQNFTGRAIARIFHGIGSPCYPAEIWGKVRKFWRCLLHVNFNLIVKLANEELKKAK